MWPQKLLQGPALRTADGRVGLPRSSLDPAAGTLLATRRKSNAHLRLCTAAQQPGSGHTQTAHRRPSPSAAPTPCGAPSGTSRAHQHQALQALTRTAAAHPTPSPPTPAAPASLLARAQAFLTRTLSSPHDSIIFSLAAPAILALAADPLLAMVDTAIVGHLGQNELGALGVNNSLFGFAFVVFNFLSTATTPMVAAALSAGDKTKAGETILQALGLASVLGVLVTLGLNAEADSALQFMGLPQGGSTDPAMYNMAKDFLMVRATAAPAALLVTVSQGVFRGLQDMRTPLGVTLATNVVHLALSLLFIFPGHWGVTGAAASTSIAEWLAAGTYLILGWQRRKELGLDPLPAMDVRRAWKQYLPFLQAGGAVLMRTAVLLGTKTLASAVATRLGPASIASHQVLTQVWSMSSLLIDSLGISGQTLVAVSLGQGDRATARAVTDRLLQLGVGLGVGLAGLLALLGPTWPHLFTQDQEVLGLVSLLMPLAVWMLPLNAMVYVLDGVLVGASDFQFLVGAMVLASGAAAALLLSVEPLQLGLAGVWGAQVVLMAGRAATLGARYWSSSGPLPPPSSTPDARSLPAVAGGRSDAHAQGQHHKVDGALSSGSWSGSLKAGAWEAERVDAEADVVHNSHSNSSGRSSDRQLSRSLSSGSSGSRRSDGGLPRSAKSDSSRDRLAATAGLASQARSYSQAPRSDGAEAESVSNGYIDLDVYCGEHQAGCGPVPDDAPELAGAVRLARPLQVGAAAPATAGGRSGRGTA